MRNKKAEGEGKRLNERAAARSRTAGTGSPERVQALLSAAPKLTEWFAVNMRSFPWREGRTPYKVLVSESMLQQTRIEAVLKYYERFMEAFPTLTALAEAPEDLVMKHWEGLGYYSRARNLKKCAELCAEEYGGRLPGSFEALIKLPGLGSYSAGAVASLCYEEPVPAVDGNVLRVLARFFGDGRDVRLPEVRKEAEEIIRAVLKGRVPVSLFNEGLMELGETLCASKGKPQCEACPLRDACAAHAAGTEEQLPYRSAGAARTVEEKTVWLFVCGGRTGLEKRPDTGLLRGLYGFPMTEGRLDEDGAAAVLAARGITPVTLRPLGPAKHVFTHREWHMTGCLAETEEPLPGLIYVTAEELQNDYALPSAFRAYREALLKELR